MTEVIKTSKKKKKSKHATVERLMLARLIVDLLKSLIELLDTND